MHPLLLEFDYNDRPHLYQLYAGLSKLAKKNVVLLKVGTNSNYKHSILKIKVNKKVNVVFDTLDGFNWIDGTIEDNLKYFQTNFSNTNYYFKRSYNELLDKFAPKNCQVFPLGLNYLVYPSEPIIEPPLIEKVKYYLKKNKLLNNFISFNTNAHNSEIFEFFPNINQSIKILFLTRLWNPDDVKDDRIKFERDNININRIRYIKICKEEFGELFTGGVVEDDFSKSFAPNFCISHEMSKRNNFLKLIREHQICIATTGLHDSIGWKFGEYVAAARGIISEPIKYTLPGNFLKQENYLEFSNDINLINNIYYLQKNQDYLQQMMMSNMQYYNNYVKPENLVFNALLKISLKETKISHINKKKVI